MRSRSFVIVNPAAGGGAAGRRWPSLRRELKEAIGPFEERVTTAPGEASLLATQAAQEGYSLVVSCGGDGTTHEVVNGLWKEERGERPTLGILSLGTGGDLLRGLGIPREIEAQIKVLQGSKSRRIDLGRIVYRLKGGKKEERIFVNVADAGMGADVMIRGKRWKAYHRKVAYFLSTLQSFLHWKNKWIEVKVDGKKVFEGESILVAVANGSTFGSGMPIAPKASLSDGQLEVTLIGKLSPWEMVAALPLLYAKELHRLPHVATFQGQKIELGQIALVSAEKVLLDIDGEPVGELPASIEVIPQALEVKAP